MTPLLLRLFDVRPAEARGVGAAFAALLFIVVGHTVLETVRDATFLVHVGAGGLGTMYIVTAALTLAVGAISSGVSARFGVRRALVSTALFSAAGAAAFCFLPPTEAVLTCLYAFSAVSGALLVPQLWVTVAALFHAGQGRRLFGTIAIAGLLGAVLGTLATAGALLVLDLRWLFLVSGGAFAVSTGFIALVPSVPAPRAGPKGDREPERDGGAWWGAFRAEPFLLRIGLVVALGAVTTLFADYLFKAVAAARLPPGELASFFARYYAAMNVLALLVQVLLSRRVLARAGVVGTAGIMPGLMLWGSVAGFVSGGAMVAVAGTRAVDGALRHSVHRTVVELLYLAVPVRARTRAKPIIDGAVTRLSQAAAAALIVLLVHLGRGSIRAFAFVAVCSAAGWIAATVTLRGPYVALFRRALLGTDHEEARSAEELDLASVELLVEALSSPSSREAIAAMDALARRNRAGLVPALMLLRDEEDVIEHALDLFASSPRTDWIHLADRLLADRRERVRRATMRALARARRASVGSGATKEAALERPWIRGYLAIDALARGPAPYADPLALLTADADGREARLGMLTAMGDAEPDARIASVLEAIVDRVGPARDRATVELVARAAARVGATALVPWLMGVLTLRDETSAGTPHTIWRGPAEGRAIVRAALAALGEPAFERLEEALLDPATSRHLRMHLPLSIAEFKSRRAADVLLRFVQGGDDGLVRYRCLRGLERLVTEHGVRVQAAEARPLVRRELTEYFRLLALRVGLEPAARTPAPDGAVDDTRAVVLRLLDDKGRQALARAFRLLKVCHPSEDLHQVHAALGASDATTRANAVEFLDALLAPRRSADNDGVRALLRLVAEDLPAADRVARAAVLAPNAVPRGPDDAIALMVADRDALLAALAAALVDEQGGRPRDAGAHAGEAGAEGAAVAGILLPVGAHGR